MLTDFHQTDTAYPLEIQKGCHLKVTEETKGWEYGTHRRGWTLLSLFSFPL